MGQFFSIFSEKLIDPHVYKVLMLGLDSAGKTTILHRIKDKKFCETSPTIAFNLEGFYYKDMYMNVWDVSGSENIRSIWKHFCQNVHAIIFVVDSSDIKKIKIAADELQELLKEKELSQSILLVYANKQDLPGALDLTKLVEELKLNTLKGRNWYIQKSIATTGDGITEGFDWIKDSISQNH